MPDKSFNRTRWQLAGWYAGVMALILSLGGVTIYRLIAYLQWLSMQEEMETVAEALQETVEPALSRPGKLDPTIQSLLPGICLNAKNCAANLTTHEEAIQVEQQILSQIEQGGYCMRLLDFSHRTIALAQFPSSKTPHCLNEQFWQNLTDHKGNTYVQTSRVLHIHDKIPWGELQLARSLEDINTYLFSVEMILIGGGMLAIGLTSAASWWLAGLAMQPIQQSYEQMQQFTADAAHELRTPLAALRAMVQAALKAQDLSPQETRETLSAVDRQSHRLAQLVQSLLLLCQLDQQRSRMTNGHCCLNTLLKNLADDFEALVTAADLSFTREDRTNTLVYAIGNEDQLYRCLSNLIVNAIQYTPAGGHLTLLLEVIQAHALIHVQDSGIGIAVEDQAQIFHRFYRVDRERSRRKGGAGLGLAIAHAIAQTHNGSLQVYSQLGQGSTFTLRIPLVHPERS